MIWYLSNLFFQGSCLLAWYLNRHRLPGWAIYPAFMVLITLLTESVAAYYWLVLRQNNLFLFHGLVPVQYALLMIPYSITGSNIYIRTGIRVSMIVVALSGILFATTVQPLTVYNTYTQLLSYSLLTLWTALSLWRLLNSDDPERIGTNPLFWISAGIIFYAVSSFVITGMLNYLIRYAYPWATLLYYFTTLVAFVLYAVFTLAFYSQRLFSHHYATD